MLKANFRTLEEICRGFVVDIDMNDPLYNKDFELMAETNYIQELRLAKENRDNPNFKPRSLETVREHTALGLGAEKALETTGEFTSNKITKNAKGISYVDRQIDLTIKSTGETIQVKSFSAEKDVWFISKRQYNSATKAAMFNDYFLLVSWKKLSPLKYRYEAKYLFAAKYFNKYALAITSEYSSHIFQHKNAIKDGKCIAL